MRHILIALMLIAAAGCTSAPRQPDSRTDAQRQFDDTAALLLWGSFFGNLSNAYNPPSLAPPRRPLICSTDYVGRNATTTCY
jgi:hypothetical protein